MATWSDINALSEQLQKVQSAKSGIRIQERTWVDILNQTLKLIPEFKLIPCLDGRTYLTEEELLREIADELDAHDGRISISELESMLNIDSYTIENIYSKLNDDDSYSQVLSCFADLITEDYLKNIALTIKDILEDKGFVDIGEIMRVYNLPLNLTAQIMSNPKFKIRTRKDNEIYYTDEYISMHKARVRGHLSACLSPVQINKLSIKLNISERLMVTMIDNLISSGDLNGSFGPGKTSYVPQCFSSSQSSYIQNFYRDNRFVEFALLRKFGVNDPPSFCKNQLQDSRIFGETIISGSLLSQIQNGIDEGFNDQTWLETQPYFPIGLRNSDMEAILVHILQGKSARILNESAFICTQSLLDTSLEACDDFLKSLAEKVAHDNAKLVKSLKLEIQSSTGKKSQKVASSSSKGSGVGGYGAREIKTKNTKKKYHTKQSKNGGNSDEDDFEEVSIDLSTYLIADSVIEQIKKKLPIQLPPELLECIEEELRPSLLQKLATYAQSVVLQGSEVVPKKQDFVKVSEEMNNTIQAIFAYEHGLEYFEDCPLLQDKLLNHLLRTQCSMILNQTLCHLLVFYNINLNELFESKAVPKQKPKRGTKKTKSKKQKDDWSSDDEPSSQTKAGGGSGQDDSSDNGYVKIDQSEVDEGKPANPDPEELTPELRTQIVERIKNVNRPETKRLATELILLCQLVKSQQTYESKPLDKYLAALEYAAVDCLGMQLPFLYLFQQDPKRKQKAAKMRSVELMVQVETQLQEAFDQLDKDPPTAYAQISLTSACLFAQVLAGGWPICATGKLVPDLNKWIANRLTNGPSTAGAKFLAEQNAGELALTLTQIVVALVRGDREESLLKSAQDTAHSIKTIVLQCRKLVSNIK
ncbi:E3 UFM1-protein ligase 1 [Cichlidogyrus casuarinus]|uniref:E3 UFM1-protein ligase 1 n=1 Tax=Cichlidogyrus casuarinus TaxID=1844966 RepID=A0ABD2QBL2_9PLAT